MKNRQRILDAAEAVFAAEGLSVPVDVVAERAGVGVGTLYRHFPKRIDVVEAVYRTDVDDLVLAAEKAVADLEPWPALVSWLDAFVRYARGKRTFLTELHEAFEKNPQLRVRARERIDEAASIVMDRARAAGVARDDIDGADLMLLVGPICTNSQLSEEQGRRLLATVLAGVRRTA
ncbi:MAG TPA: TetR/AcrR family transcriptional regulator [Acidimicrobiales bacterium]|nr:TetR/AcrR family transcriptional regulator [Acidimicrobiales bacterium]